MILNRKHNESRPKTAFTLIELLVVLAVIIILASFIMIPLERFRERARDARIIADMDLIRKGSQTYQALSNNYIDFCASSNVADLAADIAQQRGKNYSCQDDTADGGRSFCAQITLNSSNALCIDYNLVSQQGLTCSGSHPFECQ